MMNRSPYLKMNLQHFADPDPLYVTTESEIQALKREKRELQKRAQKSEDLTEVRKMSIRVQEIADRIDELQERSSAGPLNPIGTFYMSGGGGDQQQTNERSSTGLKNVEQRSAQLEMGKAVQFDMAESELRSITVAGGNVALATHSSKQLNPAFLEVSSLVDLVKIVPLPGGESYKSGFIVSSGSAGYTDESANYHDNEDVKTDFVKIDKAKITTYFELPEEVQKLGGSHYMSFALEAARTAVRKKLSEQIINGAGGSNSLVGIFKAPVNVIPSATDLKISEFNETVLDEIVFSHGGDEAVEGGAYLILNKRTLAEFSKIRATDGKRLYVIKLDPTGNAGTISSENSFEVPFIINSAVKSFQEASQDEYFLAYGKPMAYELALFSGLEVAESKDFKFKSGQVAIKASVFAGGNTASFKGFTRVKKAVQT